MCIHKSHYCPLFSSLRDGGLKKPPVEANPSLKSVTKSKSSSALLQDVKASVKGSSHMSLGVYRMSQCVLQLRWG